MFESEQDLKMRVIASSLYLAVKGTESESVEGEHVQRYKAYCKTLSQSRNFSRQPKTEAQNTICQRCMELHVGEKSFQVEETRQDKSTHTKSFILIKAFI